MGEQHFSLLTTDQHPPLSMQTFLSAPHWTKVLYHGLSATRKLTKPCSLTKGITYNDSDNDFVMYKPSNPFLSCYLFQSQLKCYSGFCFVLFFWLFFVIL